MIPRAFAHLAMVLSLVAAEAAAQPPVPLRPGTTLFQLDLSRTPVGELPASLELTTGLLEVAIKNGVPMLKASAASEFRIPLGQVLPADFTVEFDLIPKLGSNPQDLSFEGTPTINQGAASAHVLWHATGYLSVIGGGGDTYEAPMPEDLRATLPGVLTHVAVEVQGSTLKLYTNGRRLYTLQKQFARGAVLRVFLGGQDGGTEAVYLAGLRVTAGSGLGIVAQGPGPVLPSGSTTFVPPVPGSPGGAQPQQTASNQFGLTGGSGAGSIAVTVTMGTSGPLVSWSAVSGATGYTVTRSKSDDLNCCNTASGRSWAATSPWQDSPLPMPGTYLYTVIANTRQGQLQGQTLVAFGLPQVTPPVAANAGIPSGGFAVTVSLGSAGPVVSWPAVPNATSYAVVRWKSDDPSCCNNSSGPGRGWGAVSPWQDQPLLASGAYLYAVTALTPVGALSAQAQFDFQLSGGTTPPPVTLLPAIPPSGTITPMAPPPPAPPSSTTLATTGGTIVSPTRPGGVQPVLPNTAPAAWITVTGTPTTAHVAWTTPNWTSTPTYRVRRALAGTTNFTTLTPTPVSVNALDDNFPDPRASYSYEVTAIYADGSTGTWAANFTPPPPADPTNFTAAATGIDEVDLSWSGIAGNAEYFITGPGTGNGVTLAGVPGPSQRLHHVIKGLTAGTHTWKIASSYLPGGVLTAAAQWPAATVTLAAAGKYEISIESVKATSMANDDIFHGDGMHNEFYVTAFVRTKDNAGKILGEASFQSVTYGDNGNWPTRVQAGSAKPTGGIMSGDLIAPIWEQPSQGATGYRRMSLWSGTLTAGGEFLDIAPAIWETDNTPRTWSYDDALRRDGYAHLSLDTRTSYGLISNVMLPVEHWLMYPGNYLNFFLWTPGDRPIGITKLKDGLDDYSRFFPFAITVDQQVAEKALAGAYGAPGLIPIEFVDHQLQSKDPITHPDLGMGNYTLNIRIKRLP